MAIIAVTGDAATTTAVAIAAAWPESGDALLVEADPSGGDLAAWFDLPATPSLSTVVTRAVDGAWPEIEQLTRLAGNGLRVITAPARAGEATQAVAEAGRALVPTLASMRTPVAIADIGRGALASTHPFVGSASVVVVTHRQAVQSAAAAAVRLQRLAEQLDALGGVSAPIVAVVGATPFPADEVERFLAESHGAVTVVGLPVDALTASAYAGRPGISPRRIARLPLARAAADLVTAITSQLASDARTRWRAAR